MPAFTSLPLQPLQLDLLSAPRGSARPGNGVLQFALDLIGPVDCLALRAAADDLIGTSPYLRATVRRSPDGSLLAPLPVGDAGTRVDELDLRGLDPAGAEQYAAAHATAERTRDLLADGRALLRLLLVRLPGESCRLVVTHHHLLLDGWSQAALVRELFVRYRGLSRAGADAAGPRAGFLSRLARRDDAAAATAWQAEFAGQVVVAIDPQASQAGEPVRLTASLSVEETRQVRASAASCGLSENSVVQAVWALLLGRVTGSDDVRFGGVYPLAGVVPGSQEETLGPLRNILPVRVRLAPDRSLLDVAREIDTFVQRLAPHQHCGLNAVASAIGTPVPFDSIAALEGDVLACTSDTSVVPGVEVRLASSHDANDLPLSFSVLPGPAWTLRLDHRPRSVPTALANSLLDSAGALLRVFAATPDERSDALRGRSLVAQASVADPGPRDARAAGHTILDVVDHWVTTRPSAPAVAWREGADERVCSYRDLSDRADALAANLRRRGIGRGSRVALVVRRCPELVLGMLGVLRAGAAFLPVDPAIPSERIAFILDDAAPQLVLTTELHREVLPSRTAVPVECLDLTAPAPLAGPIPERPGLDSDAYVIYTSGSSGRPKGVVVTHAGVVSLAAEEVERFAVDPTSRVLQYSSPGFDAAVLEWTAATAAGATVVIAPEGLLVADQLADALDLTAATVALIPPAALATLDPDRPTTLKTLVVGGEACPTWLVTRWAGRVRLVNAYGPTECTVAATISEPLTAESSPTIGAAIRNMRVYLLGADLGPVDVHLAGEIYLGGPGLARGYLGRADLTAARFVPDLYGPPGSRMYRTGDIAHRDEAGNLHFHGRVDNQVKLNGYRIELGEIEETLSAHPSVATAVVLMRGTSPTGRQLAGFVTPASDEVSPDPAELRRHALATLPEYMVPAALVAVQAMPLTPAGKIDRDALIAGLELTDQASAELDGERQHAVAAAFAAVLDLHHIGPHADFFDLGGNSIMASLGIAEIRKRGLRVTARQLYELRTVAKLAAAAQPVAPPRARPVGSHSRTALLTEQE